MLFTIPSYRVTFTIPPGDVPGPYAPGRTCEWRVSEGDLDAFFKILRWNGVDKYAVEKEDGP